MKEIIKKSLFILAILSSSLYSNSYDLLIGGILSFDLGIGKISYGLIDTLSDSLKIGYSSSGVFSLGQDPYLIKNKVVEIIEPVDASFFLHIDSLPSILHDDYNSLISSSTIKCVYSMFEASAIPTFCADYFNNNFDVVLVPDPFLIDVYKNSGVILPIFCIPTGLYLDKFLKIEQKKSANKLFTFGCVANRWARKNLKKLITVFSELFGNNNDYQLKIHASGYHCGESLEEYVEQLKISNVFITSEMFSEDDCVDFIKTCDCYILLSKAEGFSNTPREAMAAGIPCIITDNTGHATICNSGNVIVVPSNIEVDAWDEVFLTITGKQYDCKNDDVKRAMLYVVTHYQECLDRAVYARKWVKQYEWVSLKNYYTTFFNPQSVVFGQDNSLDILTRTVYTNDSNLYHKFKELMIQKFIVDLL